MKKILIIITILIIYSGCCPNFKFENKYISNTLKEWIDFEENSWWIYKYSKYNYENVLMESKILDTIYLIKKDIIYDTNYVWKDKRGFCWNDADTFTTEKINYYFCQKKEPLELGIFSYYDNWYETVENDNGECIFINNYIFKNGIYNNFNKLVLLKINRRDESCYDTDFSAIDTLTVEGVLYHDVLENNFNLDKPYPTSSLNPQIWLTKKDWIIKIVYYNNNFKNVITLIDKHVIKNN